MEFECQKATEIGLANSSQDSSHNPCKEKLGSDQITAVKPEKSKFSSCKLIGKRGISSPGLKDSVIVNVGLGNNAQSIIDLPCVLISEILNCLDVKDLGVASCVNTLLNKLVSEHRVWKEFYRERWGCPVGLEPLGPGDSDEKSWKGLFVERESRSRMFMGRYNLEALHGHTEAVRSVFVLASKKLVFSSGYDQIVRMWDMEEGLCIASSRPLGSTIRAVAADMRLLVVGSTDGFIHGWRAEEGNPHVFDIMSPQSQDLEFQIWEHAGPITCLALDSNMIYSGSWDMAICVWDRSSLKCLKILMHNDWVWSLCPHDTTVASTAGSDVCVWDTATGELLVTINNTHVSNTFSLARSHTGKLLFTGGEDGSVHMFEMTKDGRVHGIRKVSSWAPHTGPVYSLTFEFPWLVSASSDGKLSLIDVRKLLKTSRPSTEKRSLPSQVNQIDAEPPQRMLHGFGSNLFSVHIGLNRIVCGGEEGVVRIWNFSQALEYEQRVRTLRSLRAENRRRRSQPRLEMTNKGGQSEQCSVAARKSWHGKRRVSGKVKA